MRPPAVRTFFFFLALAHPLPIDVLYYTYVVRTLVCTLSVVLARSELPAGRGMERERRDRETDNYSIFGCSIF